MRLVVLLALAAVLAPCGVAWAEGAVETFRDPILSPFAAAGVLGSVLIVSFAANVVLFRALIKQYDERLKEAVLVRQTLDASSASQTKQAEAGKGLTDVLEALIQNAGRGRGRA